MAKKSLNVPYIGSTAYMLVMLNLAFVAGVIVSLVILFNKSFTEPESDFLTDRQGESYTVQNKHLNGSIFIEKQTEPLTINLPDARTVKLGSTVTFIVNDFVQTQVTFLVPDEGEIDGPFSGLEEKVMQIGSSAVATLNEVTLSDPGDPVLLNNANERSSRLVITAGRLSWRGVLFSNSPLNAPQVDPPSNSPVI